jgi:hypothetical protein
MVGVVRVVRRVYGRVCVCVSGPDGVLAASAPPDVGALEFGGLKNELPGDVMALPQGYVAIV